MSDIVILASRILMSAVFVVYGSLKFMDVSSIINNPGTKRFMDLVASGAADRVRHGSVMAITADEYATLAGSGSNLLTNPGFESSLTGWSVSSPDGTGAAAHVEANP